ncbi:hypothetical protein CF319_g6824 [Tilletia indica]|nr:hypothetical protein CF319_g6824 [Tilletia indica]
MKRVHPNSKDSGPSAKRNQPFPVSINPDDVLTPEQHRQLIKHGRGLGWPSVVEMDIVQRVFEHDRAHTEALVEDLSEELRERPNNFYLTDLRGSGYYGSLHAILVGVIIKKRLILAVPTATTESIARATNQILPLLFRRLIQQDLRCNVAQAQSVLISSRWYGCVVFPATMWEPQPDEPAIISLSPSPPPASPPAEQGVPQIASLTRPELPPAEQVAPLAQTPPPAPPGDEPAVQAEQVASQAPLARSARLPSEQVATLARPPSLALPGGEPAVQAEQAAPLARSARLPSEQVATLARPPPLAPPAEEPAVLRRGQVAALARTPPAQAPPTRQQPVPDPQTRPICQLIPPIEWRRTGRYPVRNGAKMLGRGGFGMVYHCSDLLNPSRDVAKKRQLVSANEPDLPRYLKRELDGLKRCQGHRNFVEVLDIIFEPNKDEPYVDIIMPLAHTSLASLVNDNPGGLDQAAAKTYMHQIVQGVAWMHQRGWLHLDLKPGNLLIFKDHTVQITDLSLSRRCTGERLPQPIGTLGYRPPEELFNTHYAHHSMDIWPLAVIYTEMRSGSHLFDNRDPLTCFQQIIDLVGMKHRTVFRTPVFDAGIAGAVGGGKIFWIRDANYARLSHLSPNERGFVLEMMRLEPLDRPRARDIMRSPFWNLGPRPDASVLLPLV